MIDVAYTASANNPIDDTVVGSTELSRNNEITLEFLGIGGDFHYEHARGRLMTQFGMRSTQVPRNDGSTMRGQFDLQTALRYVSEAYGGYHWDALHGINLDAGIFMSYVGLFSYDNFENWMYLPSFTSDNTPWFFNGMRLQIFPSDKLKIEPWLINGWQSYGKFNEMPGFGAQVLYRPVEWLSVLSNDYVGWDTQDDPGRMRFHTDNSLQIRWYNDPSSKIFNKVAFSLTGDLGGETGDGVTPFGGHSTNNTIHSAVGCTIANPCTQHFLSWMTYQPRLVVSRITSRSPCRRRRDEQPRKVPRPPAHGPSRRPSQRRSASTGVAVWPARPARPFSTQSWAPRSTRSTTKRAFSTCPTSRSPTTSSSTTVSRTRPLLRGSRRRDVPRRLLHHGDPCRVATGSRQVGRSNHRGAPRALLTGAWI
jgi:hypothetical protein